MLHYKTLSRCHTAVSDFLSNTVGESFPSRIYRILNKKNKLCVPFYLYFDSNSWNLNSANRRLLERVKRQLCCLYDRERIRSSLSGQQSVLIPVEMWFFCRSSAHRLFNRKLPHCHYIWSFQTRGFAAPLSAISCSACDCQCNPKPLFCNLISFKLLFTFTFR